MTGEIGLFSVDAGTRRIRGYLVPWDELSRTSVDGTGPVKFRKGDLKLPRSPRVAKLNKDHKPVLPMGIGALFAEHDRGLYAEFEIDDSEDGDAFLADHGEYVRLSAEVRDMVREGEYATAQLTGAALVPAGAFASAALFALAPEDERTEDSPEPEETEADASAEEEEDAVADATVPTGLPAPTPVEVQEVPQGISARAMFAAMSRVSGGQASRDDLDLVRRGMADLDGAAMFALSDIHYSGVGGIGAAMTPSQWIGEVIDGVEYSSLFAGLFGHKDLTAATYTGWRWGVKPAGAAWPGNKAPIPSNQPTLEPVTESAFYWAGGHDHAIEHRHFNTPGYFESYYAAMTESYLKFLDAVILTEAFTSATDIEADDPTGLDIGAGWSAIIDGAFTISQAGLKPTAAVVDGTLWKSMAKLPQSDVLGYLNAQLSLTGDGRLETFSVVPAPEDAAFPVGHTLVVAKSAADVYELPGVPIRQEALNIAQGGIDTGVFGYAGFLVKNLKGIVDVAPFAAARTASSKK
jgi:hypothetical protein